MLSTSLVPLPIPVELTKLAQRVSTGTQPPPPSSSSSRRRNSSNHIQQRGKEISATIPRKDLLRFAQLSRSNKHDSSPLGTTPFFLTPERNRSSSFAVFRSGHRGGQLHLQGLYQHFFQHRAFSSGEGNETGGARQAQRGRNDTGSKKGEKNKTQPKHQTKEEKLDQVIVRTCVISMSTLLVWWIYLNYFRAPSSAR